MSTKEDLYLTTEKIYIEIREAPPGLHRLCQVSFMSNEGLRVFVNANELEISKVPPPGGLR